MTPPIGVHTAPGARSTAAIEAVLASLPLSYASTRLADSTVAVISGSPGWPAAAADALDAGAAVVVVLPEPADVHPLDGCGGVIALDTRWAPNPVIEDAAAAFAAALPGADRLECAVRLPVGSRVDAAMVDQLSLVRALLGPVSGLSVLTRSVHGYAAEGTAAGHPVDLSLTCTDAAPARATVRLLTDDGGVDLTVPDGDTARPARLSVTGPDGTLLSPTLYESARRATWRRVRTLLDHQSTAADLHDFTVDQETALTALRLDEAGPRAS